MKGQKLVILFGIRIIADFSIILICNKYHKERKFRYNLIDYIRNSKDTLNQYLRDS